MVMNQQKYIILGGRSGTTAMARLLQLAGLNLWHEQSSTEPPNIRRTILANIYNPDAVKKALTSVKVWNLAKLPEFAFVLPVIEQVFPSARFIWMRRPLQDRVSSHVHLGWHYKMMEYIKKHPGLFHLIEETTGERIGKGAIQNDILYFKTMDLLTEQFFSTRKTRLLVVQYDHFNSDFAWIMRNVATWLDIDFVDNIETWKQAKAQPQQQGRWQFAH